MSQDLPNIKFEMTCDLKGPDEIDALIKGHLIADDGRTVGVVSNLLDTQHIGYDTSFEQVKFSGRLYELPILIEEHQCPSGLPWFPPKCGCEYNGTILHEKEVYPTQFKEFRLKVQV